MKELSPKILIGIIVIFILLVPIILFSPLLLILKKLFFSWTLLAKVTIKSPKFWLGAKQFFIKHASLKFIQEAGLYVIKKYTDWDRIFTYYFLRMKRRTLRHKRRMLKAVSKHKRSVMATSVFTTTGLGVAVWSAWKYIWMSLLGFIFKILIKPILLVLIMGLDLLLAPTFTLLYDLIINLLIFVGLGRLFGHNKNQK